MIQSYDHEITYDPGNRKTIVRDSVGAVTVYEMDEVNAVVAITDAHGGRASYERCPNTGKVLRVTNALGEAVEKAYDARVNLVRVSGADGAATRFLANLSVGVVSRPCQATCTCSPWTRTETLWSTR